jgi:spore maturation protein CgeB
LNILIIGKNISDTNSMDYFNIVMPIKELGNEIILYNINKDKSSNILNINLICKNQKLDLIFIIPVEDEIDFKFVSQLSKTYNTLAYFYDDTWRINYSTKWASCVDYIVTSDINWRLNFDNIENVVIYAPFFVNTNIYKCIDSAEKDIDVSFVGQYHPARAWIINYLKNQGIQVKVFGKGWSNNSEISHKEMIEIFNKSKINLNLSNCINFDINHLVDFKNNDLKSLLKSYKLIFRSLYTPDMKIYEMVKARFFEINACKGFQISFYTQGLEQQYSIGEEIEIFENYNQLVRKIKYFLNHAELREKIANAGYVKTLNEHDSKIRLKYIFSKITRKSYSYEKV